MKSQLRPLQPWFWGGALLLGYLLAMFVFYDRLPEQWSFDSSYLQDLMSGGSVMEADSYGATAKVLGAVPEGLLQSLIMFLGIGVIGWFASGLVTVPAGATAVVLLLPVLLMGLLRPQKEVLVVAMSLLVMASLHYAKKPWVPLVLLAGLYGTYGFFVRPYYLLILVLVGVLYTLPRWPKWLLPLVAVTGVYGLWLLPPEIFMSLQGVRDDNNFERIMGELGNRTFFFNPFSPEHPLGFVGNYAYAALRLNLPVLFSIAPQEIFLTVTAGLYGVLVVAMLAWGNVKARLAGSLFLAHLLVLWLFEPDLGSYLRHASSAVMYLLPGLVLWQEYWLKPKALQPAPQTPRRPKSGENRPR